MAPTSEERREVASESWTQCPHCGSWLRTWDRWFGSTLWVRRDGELEPERDFRHCPNCGEELERSESDGNDQ